MFQQKNLSNTSSNKCKICKNNDFILDNFTLLSNKLSTTLKAINIIDDKLERINYIVNQNYLCNDTMQYNKSNLNIQQLSEKIDDFFYNYQNKNNINTKMINTINKQIQNLSIKIDDLINSQNDNKSDDESSLSSSSSDTNENNENNESKNRKPSLGIFNSIDFITNFVKSQKNKENLEKNKEEKYIESDDEYDENFDIFNKSIIEENNNDNKNDNNNGDRITNIKDIIMLSEKYEKNIDEGKMCDNYFVLNDKKYNINLKTVCKLKKPLEKLNRMVGLKNIKKQIFNMVIYYLQGFENKNKNMLHSTIEGSPGTGKTKLGKILGEIYCALDIIPSNKFKYVKATDMIGDHVGVTKHMTQSVIDEADGGVLFIDEAYALSTSETKDPYGKECMDTLNFNLSEKKKKLIVIIAGYPEQLEKCFFSHNPGLQRRFPFRFKVDKYSSKELSEIFQNKLREIKWQVNNTISQSYLDDFFSKNIDCFKNYGGDIENFIKVCQFSHSNRTITTNLDPTFRKKLSLEDLNNGLEEFKKNKKQENDYYKHMFS